MGAFAQFLDQGGELAVYVLLSLAPTSTGQLEKLTGVVVTLSFLECCPHCFAGFLGSRKASACTRSQIFRKRPKSRPGVAPATTDSTAVDLSCFTAAASNVHLLACSAAPARTPFPRSHQARHCHVRSLLEQSLRLREQYSLQFLQDGQQWQVEGRLEARDGWRSMGMFWRQHAHGSSGFGFRDLA